MLIVGLAFTGDRLLTNYQQVEAQTAERPNFVFVMTDDLDERSMEQLDGIRERNECQRHHVQERLRHLLLVLP